MILWCESTQLLHTKQNLSQWDLADQSLACLSLPQPNQASLHQSRCASAADVPLACPRHPESSVQVATPPPKVGRLQGLFSKLRRGSSKEEEDYDLSRPASIAGPQPLDSQADPSPVTKSGQSYTHAVLIAGSCTHLRHPKSFTRSHACFVQSFVHPMTT